MTLRESCRSIKRRSAQVIKKALMSYVLLSSSRALLQDTRPHRNLVAIQLFSISEGEVAERKAIQAHRSKNYHECIEQATVVLQTATHSVDMRELRVTCSLNEGDVDRAVGDLT
jgi:hypothetical protein